MVQAARPEAGDPNIFEQSCEYCGARMRVLAAQVPQDNHTQDYECPECGKSYETEAAAEPRVQLLKPRTDGKDDKYQETFF